MCTVYGIWGTAGVLCAMKSSANLGRFRQSKQIETALSRAGCFVETVLYLRKIDSLHKERPFCGNSKVNAMNRCEPTARVHEKIWCYGSFEMIISHTSVETNTPSKRATARTKVTDI
jgi:hypothetical protein